MNNLLEKASILTTPTAYDDGKILSVKPEPGLGSELITNGSFDTDSDWNKQTSNWTIANGYAICDGLQTSNSSLFQDVAVINGKRYKIDFTITDSANDLNLILGATTIGQYGAGTHSIYVTKDSNASARIFFQATASNAFQGSLDNVSVKQVIDGDFDFTRNSSATRVNAQGLVEDVQILSSNLVQNGDFSQEGSEQVTNGSFDSDSDWTKQTSWSISGSAANYDFLSDAKYIRQTLLSGGFVAGKAYKISFEITSGTAYMNVNSNGGGLISLNTYSVGSYSIYVTASASGSDLLIYGRNTSGTAFSIDNVSVKEVGQDWTLGTGWSIGENKAVFNDTANGDIRTSSIFTANSKYRISLSVSDLISGTAFFALGAGAASNLVSYANYTNGDYTFEVISPNSLELRIYATTSSGSSFSIDNVSVIEITDDTDLPRINYKDGEGSLLLENQSTNLVTYSEDFSQWTRNTTNIDTPSNVTQTNPSGESESGFININNGVSATKFIYKSISTTSSIHTQSVFFKYHSRQWVQLLSGGTSHYANFDIQNGAVGNVFGCTATIEDCGSGWYKCTATLSSASTPTNMVIAVLDDDATSRLPNSTGTGSYYVWGAQVEALSYTTSYIPTNGSTVTRLADVCNNSGNSDLINSTEGVLYAEIAALANYNTYRWLSISDNTHSNAVKLGFLPSATDFRVATDIRSENTGQAFMTYNFGAITPTMTKVAVKYKANDFAFWVNGTKVVTDTSGNTPIGLSSIQFYRGDSGQALEGNVKCVAVFKEALTDEELTCLTTI